MAGVGPEWKREGVWGLEVRVTVLNRCPQGVGVWRHRRSGSCAFGSGNITALQVSEWKCGGFPGLGVELGVWERKYDHIARLGGEI